MERVEIIEKIRTFLLTDVLENKEAELGDDQPLFTAGVIDSYAFAHLSVFLEQEFNVFVQNKGVGIDAFDTLNMMADIVLEDIAG